MTIFCYVFIVIFFLSNSIFANEKRYESEIFQLGMRENLGRGLGYNRSYTTLEANLFSLFETAGVIPFVDVRGHFFSPEQYAENVGLGIRKAFTPINMILGANVYYDGRSRDHLQFNQIGCGLEVLSNFICFQVNGYFPFRNRVQVAQENDMDSYVGGYVLSEQEILVSFTGGDFIFEMKGKLSEKMDGSLFAGSYFYHGELFGKVLGVRAGIGLKIFNWFDFGVSITRDHLFKTRVQGQLGVSFSFGSKTNLYVPEKRDYYQKVKRNEIVVLKQTTRYLWNY